jgi:hypothetical protein
MPLFISGTCVSLVLYNGAATFQISNKRTKNVQNEEKKLNAAKNLGK